MNHLQLYATENNLLEEEIVEAFYRTLMKEYNEKKITLQDIEQDLTIDMKYLEECLETVDSYGIDHVRSALSQILYEQTGVLQKTYIRIAGFPTVVPFSSLRHTMVGKVFSLVGVVARIESALPIPTKVIFSCAQCKVQIEHLIKQGIFDRPTKCKGKCKSKKFNLQPDSPRTQLVDHQRIRLHEISLNQGKDNTKPGTIQCILHRSFVNTLLPGDVIQVLGIGIAEENETDRYTLAVEINNLVFLKHRDHQEKVLFSPEEILQIKKVSEYKDVTAKLSQALFNDVIGNTQAKEGILLSLVGGSQKTTRRQEIHTLLVGDPGMGKSKLLRIASVLLPRSNYVCGTTCTSAGLGVSVHSKSGGEYALEAGALVLSDLGHCFIDELDKLDSNLVLFEALEKQKISIVKAGMVCTMPCRSSVVAAANPCFGRYLNDKPLSVNLSFSEAFLSRFDLIFLMLSGAPGTENDIASHLLSFNETQPNLLTTPIECTQTIDPDKSEIITPELAKKYIQYARESIHPVLSSSAKSLIVQFYSDIASSTPEHRTIQEPTPRVIDSIIRVAEAKAKLDLRNITTKSDVEYAISLCTIDKSFISPQTRPKTQNIHKEILSVLQQIPPQSILSPEDILSKVPHLNISSSQLDTIIDLLNHNGILLKVSRNTYKVL
ncbi:DNA helicase MCM8 [Nematocida sp. AWRm80]|nr:DNA helicase MCM8 [Nematocida sp. AWRm80]